MTDPRTTAEILHADPDAIILDACRPEEATVSLAGIVDCEQMKKISIYRNDVWAGDGILENGTICDCAAQLGRDASESEQCYTEIEEAIAAGGYGVVRGDGLYTWTIGGDA